MEMNWTEATQYLLSTEIFRDKNTTAFLSGKKKIVICGVLGGKWQLDLGEWLIPSRGDDSFSKCY